MCYKISIQKCMLAINIINATLLVQSKSSVYFFIYLLSIVKFIINQIFHINLLFLIIIIKVNYIKINGNYSLPRMECFMDNQNLNILDEVNKGATMGMDAISYVSEKVSNNQFKEVLDTEYNKYKKISQRVNNLYSNYSSKEPHETNAMNKMMTWYGIQMKTMTDDTTSKLSELLMQGTNMGIIEGRRLINQNNNSDIDSDVKNILNDFVVMQEDSIETLKKYL